ncbi:MAG TPA: matrixin family metalloprotease [Anaerolineales bacterium]|nr:matrixin family metalloprotease [Anaerolineales bacterium]
MRILKIPIIVFMLAALLVPTSVQAKPKAPGSNPSTSITGIDCGLPESNAESLEILSNYYPGYWWDHTDLTIAVQAHPNAKPEQLAAIHEAIATWSAVLDECFDGLITLTNVTGELNNPQKADITLHYVLRAGGVSFEGYAVCGNHGCPNIMVRSDPPPSLGEDPSTPEYLGWVTLHEIGHALGLGHTTNLWESTDLMGYGWPDLGDPVLSDCDIDALAFVFAWALEGSDPYPPAEGPYDCSLD